MLFPRKGGQKPGNGCQAQAQSVATQYLTSKVSELDTAFVSSVLPPRPKRLQGLQRPRTSPRRFLESTNKTSSERTRTLRSGRPWPRPTNGSIRILRTEQERKDARRSPREVHLQQSHGVGFDSSLSNVSLRGRKVVSLLIVEQTGCATPNRSTGTTSNDVTHGTAVWSRVGP